MTDFPTRQNVLRRHPIPASLIAKRDAFAAAETVDAAVPLLAAVVGVNEPPSEMSLDEVRALGDPFTSRILLEGGYPLTLSSLVSAIENIDAGAAFPVRRMFLVAEGGQVRLSNPEFQLNARLVFCWQKNASSPPDLLLSTEPVAGDEASLLQLIAWSDSDGAFHFFERLSGFWGWAGNSFHALKAPSRGKGPFDSHINGALVMKELKIPWAHWHSQDSGIPREAFPSDSEFNTNPLFAEVTGAESLERIVKNGIRRWTISRLARDGAQGGLANFDQYFRQVITATSENLISSSLEFKRVRSNVLKLPTSFFLDIEGLELAAGFDSFPSIVPTGRIEVDGTLYAKAVSSLQMTVKDSRGVAVEGDTHFCFLVPERAFEDNEVARQLLDLGVLDNRLLLSLLMVDFVNPIRSQRRAALLRYAPATIRPVETLQELFLKAIADENPAEGTPESEFLSYWKEADIHGRVRQELSDFFNGIQAAVTTIDGVTRLIKLTEWRKSLFRNKGLHKLHEFESTTSRFGETLVSPVRISKTGEIIHETN